MARILFPGAASGLILVPVMLFHILQLIVSAWIAGSLGRKADQANAERARDSRSIAE